jgi:hypothetical protein
MVSNPTDPSAGHARYLLTSFPSFYCRCHGVSQRQGNGDNDYSESDEFDQIIWPFPVRISITEKASSANAQRVISFHIYNTPFTEEMTIFILENGQLFLSARHTT